MKNMPKIEIIRHSLAHILATVVQKLYPGTKFGIGPSIENGFYYDFELPKAIAPEDLIKIEAEMRELIKKNLEFKVKDLEAKEAKKLFKNQPYKLELVNELLFISPSRSARLVNELKEK
jgi:threonyl-tRNA synthetase